VHFKVQSKQLLMDNPHSQRAISLHMAAHKIALSQQLQQR
jgi:hypothetical protein